VAHDQALSIVKRTISNEFPHHFQQWFQKIADDFLMKVVGLVGSDDDEEAAADKSSAAVMFRQNNLIRFPSIQQVVSAMNPILRPVAHVFPTNHLFFKMNEEDLTSSSSEAFKPFLEAIADNIESQQIQVVFWDLTMADCESLVLLVKNLQRWLGKQIKTSSVFVVTKL
jgi:hypothetical protein